MTTPPVVHGSFTHERIFRAPVARVFSAWSDIETKARWFMGPPDQWKLLERQLDFRVGGTELLRGAFGAAETVFAARYYEIVPNARLLYVYDMRHGDKHLSVSLATVEFAAVSGGTQMTFTEQAAFLDGEDGVPSRDVGTAAHWERLALVVG